MEFLRKLTAKKADLFKDLADDVWDELGDISKISKGMKQISRTGGKYALTAQLLMILNFPEEAEMLRDTFNITGKGPTGIKGFQGTPMAHLLEATTAITIHRDAAAKEVQGYSDMGATSTYRDLNVILPQLRSMVKQTKPTKKGKK
jgi:hypothetical protein